MPCPAPANLDPHLLGKFVLLSLVVHTVPIFNPGVFLFNQQSLLNLISYIQGPPGDTKLFLPKFIPPGAGGINFYVKDYLADRGRGLRAPA